MFLLVVSASCVWRAPAPAPSAQADIQVFLASFQVFVAKYVDAFNAKDVAQIHALYHPSVLACITPETKTFYDGVMATRWRNPIPADYTFQVSAVNEHNAKTLEAMARFPIPPAHELQIDYQQGDDLGSVRLWLVWEHDRLYSDAPCAREQALQQYRDDAAAREAFTARHRALAAAIVEPLRSQLVALVQAHETGEAVRQYKEASRLDYRTSLFVIDDLAHEWRP